MNKKNEIEKKLDRYYRKSLKSKWYALLLFFSFFKYRLVSIRDRVLKMTLWISVVVMIACTLLRFVDVPFISINREIIESVSVLGIGFTTSLLAAVFIEIFERTRKEFQTYFQSYSIRQIFECNSDENRVIISLSKFRMSSQKESEGVFRQGNDKDLITDKKVPEDDPHYFSNIAYSDAIAAAHIASLFTNNGLSLPKIFLDMEIVEAIFAENEIQIGSNRSFSKDYSLIDRKEDQKALSNSLKFKKLQTIVCIGLYSNEITMWLNSKFNANLFKIVDRDVDQNPIGSFRVRKQIQGRKIDYNSWDNSVKYTGQIRKVNGKDSIEQFAMISRISRGNKKFIIVGGQTASATKEISRYFYKNWNTILNKISERTLNEHEYIPTLSTTKDFAYIFELQVNEDSGEKHINPRKLIIAD